MQKFIKICIYYHFDLFLPDFVCTGKFLDFVCAGELDELN